MSTGSLRAFARALSVSLLIAGSAHAATDITTFTTSVNSLITQGNALVATGQRLSLNPLTMSTQLGGFSTSVSTYLTSVQTTSTTLDGSSLTLTPEALISLQALSATVAGLAAVTQMLSGQVVLQAPFTTPANLTASLTTVLRLSSDIGTMANRIGEMADRILVMSNNIGTMADRILATQVIQSTNLNLVSNVLLQSQQNTLVLMGR